MIRSLLLMPDDVMRDIRLFQVSHLFLGQSYRQSANGIFQMADLRCPMIGAVTGFFCKSQASAT